MKFNFREKFSGLQDKASKIEDVISNYVCPRSFIAGAIATTVAVTNVGGAFNNETKTVEAKDKAPQEMRLSSEEVQELQTIRSDLTKERNLNQIIENVRSSVDEKTVDEKSVDNKKDDNNEVLKELQNYKVPKAVKLSLATEEGDSFDVNFGQVLDGEFEKDGKVYEVLAKKKQITVDKGDNLYQLSQELYGHGASWCFLNQANNLENPNLIYPGDKLNYIDLKVVEKELGKPKDMQIQAENVLSPGSTSDIKVLVGNQFEEDHDNGESSVPSYGVIGIDDAKDLMGDEHARKSMKNIVNALEMPEESIVVGDTLYVEKHPVLEEVLQSESSNSIPYFNMIKESSVSAESEKSKLVLHDMGDEEINEKFSDFYQTLEDKFDMAGSSAFDKRNYLNLVEEAVKSTFEEGSCPYHFMITPDGSIIQTNEIDKKLGDNEEGVQVCMIGDYDNTTPTRQAMTSVASLRSELGNAGYDLEREIDYGEAGKKMLARKGAMNILSKSFDENPERRVEISKSGTGLNWLQSYLNIQSNASVASIGSYKNADKEEVRSELEDRFEAKGVNPNDTMLASAGAIYDVLKSGNEKMDDKLQKCIATVLSSKKLIESARKYGEDPGVRIMDYVNFLQHGSEDFARPYAHNKEQFRAAFEAFTEYPGYRRAA